MIQLGFAHLDPFFLRDNTNVGALCCKEN